MTPLEPLLALIRERHGCEAVHVESVTVREQYGRRIVWEGTVEVFALRGHRRARRCYAWQQLADNDEPQFTIVLETGHVDSPRAAVRAAMVDESRRQGE